MDKVNPLFNLILYPCLQTSRPIQVLRPAFVPIPTTYSSQLRRHHKTCKEQCIRSLDHLYFSKTQSLDQIQDDDLVALPFSTEDTSDKPQMRLCVIRNQQFAFPLVRHADDVETDLFLDPKHADSNMSLQDFSLSSEEVPYYGIGFYGQRPVPSLGGGPGYGAAATEIWSIEEDMLEKCLEDGVEIPYIDVGMAHGEKARGGALF